MGEFAEPGAVREVEIGEMFEGEDCEEHFYGGDAELGCWEVKVAAGIGEI